MHTTILITTVRMMRCRGWRDCLDVMLVIAEVTAQVLREYLVWSHRTKLCGPKGLGETSTDAHVEEDHPCERARSKHF